MANAALQAKPKEIAIDTGIERAGTEAIANQLSNALSDSVTLSLKTLGVHWNIVGADVYGMHKLTQAHDVFTADMLTARIGKNEENVLMLRSVAA